MNDVNLFLENKFLLNDEIFKKIFFFFFVIIFFIYVYICMIRNVIIEFLGERLNVLFLIKFY